MLKAVRRRQSSGSSTTYLSWSWVLIYNNQGAQCASCCLWRTMSTVANGVSGTCPAALVLRARYLLHIGVDIHSDCKRLRLKPYVVVSYACMRTYLLTTGFCTSLCCRPMRARYLLHIEIDIHSDCKRLRLKPYVQCMKANVIVSVPLVSVSQNCKAFRW